MASSWTMPEVEEAIELYRDEVSAAEIAGMLGRSKDGVLGVLRANGVSIRRRGAPSIEASQSCPSFKRMTEEARLGSKMLLEAIERAGVRP